MITVPMKQRRCSQFLTNDAMFSPKSTLFLIFYTLQVTTSHDRCKVIKKDDDDDDGKIYFLKKSVKEELCAQGYEVCCSDGCCPENQLIAILWKVCITILFIFIGVIIFIYGFYYIYEKIKSARKDDVSRTSTQMQIFNVENRNPSAPVDTQNDVGSHRVTPPPSYNEAIGERAPPYEVVIKTDGKQKF